LIKKDRVRLQEFFQDHDLLRKGYVPAKDLEREPLKKPAMFLAPSILDPKDVLNSDEERELDETL
jgi:hypothetical protein